MVSNEAVLLRSIVAQVAKCWQLLTGHSSSLWLEPRIRQGNIITAYSLSLSLSFFLSFSLSLPPFQSYYPPLVSRYRDAALLIVLEEVVITGEVGGKGLKRLWQYCLTKTNSPQVASTPPNLSTCEGSHFELHIGLQTVHTGERGYQVCCTTECIQLKCVFCI